MFSEYILTKFHASSSQFCLSNESRNTVLYLSLISGAVKTLRFQANSWSGSSKFGCLLYVEVLEA